MTQLDVLYRYEAVPAERSMIALGRVREVYGIRGLVTDERAKTIRVEYDATRLTGPVVWNLIRRCGIDLVEDISLTPPLPEPEPTPAPAAYKPA